MCFCEFPQTHRLRVDTTLADTLFTVAEQLPRYDNQEYYSTKLQTQLCARMRQSSPDGFDELIAAVRTRLAHRPYCALLHGLRFDNHNRIFVAINRAFGELVARPYEKPRAQLVHYIQPATDRPAAPNTGYESERLHTDTADWDPPVGLISMVCIRPDSLGGGRSLVIDVDAIREEVRTRLGPETLTQLESEPVPWELASYRGGGFAWRPVLTASTVCWRRYTIDQSLAALGQELTPEMSATLDAFEQMLSATYRALKFSMHAGDLLFVDNHRTLHARTPINSGDDSERLMIRSWISASTS